MSAGIEPVARAKDRGEDENHSRHDEEDRAFVKRSLADDHFRAIIRDDLGFNYLFFIFNIARAVSICRLDDRLRALRVRSLVNPSRLVNFSFISHVRHALCSESSSFVASPITVAVYKFCGLTSETLPLDRLPPPGSSAQRCIEQAQSLENRARWRARSAR